MAVNERVQRNQNDLPYGQLAPSQADRISWYPGKVNARAGDATWDRHYRPPVGLPEFEAAGPLEVERVRVEKLHRGIISDQTIAAPIVTGSDVTTTITNAGAWGTTTPVSVLTPTATQDVNGNHERTSGYDWAKGA